MSCLIKVWKEKRASTKHWPSVNLRAGAIFIGILQLTVIVGGMIKIGGNFEDRGIFLCTLWCGFAGMVAGVTLLIGATTYNKIITFTHLIVSGIQIGLAFLAWIFMLGNAIKEDRDDYEPNIDIILTVWTLMTLFLSCMWFYVYIFLQQITFGQLDIDSDFQLDCWIFRSNRICKATQIILIIFW